MVGWYAIKIDPHNISMCMVLYKCLRDRFNCEGLAGGSFYGLVTGHSVGDHITELYVQIVKDSRGWKYVGLYACASSLQYQTIVLTTNEFYSRFLQYTVTL